LIKFNDFCRKNNIGFILGSNLGLYGNTFVDFGNNYKCFDKDGEDVRNSLIVNITKE
jgi:molybdopterin/thiamine biosynthesis adenylyltransferase